MSTRRPTQGRVRSSLRVTVAIAIALVLTAQRGSRHTTLTVEPTETMAPVRLSVDPTPVRRVMDPGNPVADKEGYVYTSNVNEMGEMVDMMAASRSYQNNVEVINTARQLMMRTLEITRA